MTGVFLRGNLDSDTHRRNRVNLHRELGKEPTLLGLGLAVSSTMRTEISVAKTPRLWDFVRAA